MPKITISESYECEVCGEIYKKIREAEECEAGHDLVYVPFARSDLKRLIHIVLFANSEPQLVTPTLSKTLRRYNKIRGESK